MQEQQWEVLEHPPYNMYVQKWGCNNNNNNNNNTYNELQTKWVAVVELGTQIEDGRGARIIWCPPL
jgi:outer membrane lipoprotein SlyB